MPALRRLALLRHAKSAWDTGAPSDHARPLAARGRRDAPRMARWLRAQGWVPDAVISSDAERTRQTWAGMAPELPALAPSWSRRLYHAGLDELRALAAGWDPAWTTVLALGHNPGWELAAGALCGQDVVMKTATCVLLEGRGEGWTDALDGPWRLVAVQHPRDLAG